jgi:hypothetical protein
MEHRAVQWRVCAKYILLALVCALLVSCENNDPTGPVVNNSGSENSFAFGDRAGGSVTASAPPRPVITPVINEPPPPIFFNTRGVEDGDACVQSAGTSTRRRTC